MTYRAHPPVEGGGGNTVLTRAQTLLGAANITKVMGTDFDNDQWYRTAGSSGTVTPTTTKKGGVVTLSTTATNGRSALAMPHGTIVLLDNALASYWYMVSRHSVTSAIDVQAGADLRLTATAIGAPQIIFGVIGGTSTSFFSYLIQNNAGTVNVNNPTTVAIDTAMHIWEIWNDTTNISFALDGVVLATAASSNAGTNPVAPAIAVSNGSTAAARTIDADYLYICTGNPA